MSDLKFVKLPGRMGGGRGPAIAEEQLAQLRANPGQWALLLTVTEAQGQQPAAVRAGAAAARRRATYGADGFLFASRGASVYIRYAPNGEAPHE